MSMVRYDTATGPSGGPTPGARALEAHWRKVTGLRSLGIYNPRPIRGGKSWSTHAEGRAFDGAANAYLDVDRVAADQYCQFLIDNAAQLQVQYLIWNRRSWKSGRGWRNYNGASPHTDHVHAELNRDGARTVTVAQLDALWREWNNDQEEFTVAQYDEIKAQLDRIEHETRTREERAIELLHGIDVVVNGLHAKIRTTVYTARDGLAKLVRTIPGVPAKD